MGIVHEPEARYQHNHMLEQVIFGGHIFVLDGKYAGKTIYRDQRKKAQQYGNHPDYFVTLEICAKCFQFKSEALSKYGPIILSKCMARCL